MALTAPAEVPVMTGNGHAEPRRQQFFGIAVAPAQETDDVERLDLAQQFAAAVRFRALERLFQQGEGLEAF